MKALIVYTSMSAARNTRKIAGHIYESMMKEGFTCDIFQVDLLKLDAIQDYDVLLIGTYSWGNGEIPKEMQAIYEYIEEGNCSDMVTGIFGSGDTFYPRFCGAVDVFKYMLAEKTNLAVTLKVEASPQEKDIEKTKKLAELIHLRMSQKS